MYLEEGINDRNYTLDLEGELQDLRSHELAS